MLMVKETIDNTFIEKSNLWKGLDRSKEESRKMAEQYYEKELMPILKEIFTERYKTNKVCEGLILTLGTSYEPLVFSISALQPKKILILYSNETQELLDYVVEFTRIKPSKYSSEKIDSENPLLLYRKIKEKYEEWGKPSDIYVDFTGGTKSMAAGCAMAGAAIGAQLIYIGGKYLTTLRKPEPGSEKLCYIDNPYIIFGDLESSEAVNLFNSMDYVSAFRIFEDLDKKVPNTKKYEILKYLSKAYDNWDSFNLDEAYNNIKLCIEVYEKEDRVNFINIGINFKKLKEQKEVLQKLLVIHNENTMVEDTFKNINYLIFNMYGNALRREKQKKYEMATLLLYRVLESISQKRLYNYGIRTSKPNYEKLEISKEGLLESINILRTKMKLNKLATLDGKVSLFLGYSILAALEDDLIKTTNKGMEYKSLCKINSKVEIRNKSIFAHGYEFISKEKYLDFKNLVKEYIKQYCLIEMVDEKEIMDSIEFIEIN